MLTKQIATAVIAALLLAGASTCPAQIPQKINYQVMLTDDADQPLADQSVQLVFRIYDVEVGGGSLWTETQDVTTSAIGVVSVILGAVNPIGIDFDAPRWLEIEVDSETLSPRRELVTSPYAARAAIADNSMKLGDVGASEYVLLDDIDGPGTINTPGNPVDWDMLKNVPAGFADGTDETGGSGDGHSLDADDGSPVDALYVDSEGNVGIGTTSPNSELTVKGDMRLYSEATTTSIFMPVGSTPYTGARLSVNVNYGGSLHLSHETGSGAVGLGILDFADGGGYMQLSRGDGNDAGFVLMGNGRDNQEPRMEITGSSGDVIIDMGYSGNNSVQLPDEAVSRSEILDEPGVASVQAAPWTILNTGNITTVAARTMWVPADGFVFVMATAQVEMDNNPSQRHYAGFGVSEFQNAWSGAAQEAWIEVPTGGVTGGIYSQHVAVSGLFAVSEGEVTFYLNALESDGVCAVRGRQLTMMYFPTNYGTVDTTD